MIFNYLNDTNRKGHVDSCLHCLGNERSSGFAFDCTGNDTITNVNLHKTSIN